MLIIFYRRINEAESRADTAYYVAILSCCVAVAAMLFAIISLSNGSSQNSSPFTRLAADL